MEILTVSNATIEREGLPIVRDASISVHAGMITVLLGVNGAGKTTLLEGISGAIELAHGEIELDGEQVHKQAPYIRARRGLAHVEQGRTVFPDLTTHENLLLSAGSRAVDDAYELFPELVKRKDIASILLSGGEQQMLVLARAFLREPKVLLIDEMSLGLAPMALHRLMSSVTQLRERGIGILLVEQFASLALQVGDYASVIRGGTMVYDGDCATLRDDDNLLQRLYLGAASEAETGATA